MRALFITPVVPSPTGNGLAMRAGMWLEALSDRFDTDVAGALMFPAHASAPDFTAAHSASTTWLTGQLATGAGIPRFVPELDETSTAALHDLITQADVVVVFRLYLAGLAEHAAELGIPVVVDLDDLDWVREERLGDMQAAADFKSYADTMLHLASVATTASAIDAAQGNAIHAGPQWRHVPNGVRPPSITGDDVTPDIDLLFVATLGYAPNAQGAAWFAREVLPLLPDVTVAIIGAGPGPDVNSLAGPRVIVQGDVADVSPWYARSRAAIVPIHSGSGTRTKIPEAWAHDRPVISTTLGAEGLEIDGAALLADDPAAFSNACAKVLNDETLQGQLVRAGRERLHAAHSIGCAIASAGNAIDLALTSSGITPPALRIRT